MACKNFDQKLLLGVTKEKNCAAFREQGDGKKLKKIFEPNGYSHFNYIRLVWLLASGKDRDLRTSSTLLSHVYTVALLLTLYPDQKPFSPSSLYRLAKLSVPDRRLSLAAALASLDPRWARKLTLEADRCARGRLPTVPAYSLVVLEKHG